MVVPGAPVVALAERKLLWAVEALDGLTCDASGGEGVAGIVELSALKAGLDGAPILGETKKRMQVDPPAKDVLKFDPDWKPVLSRHKAERDQQGQEPLQLLSINGKVKILMGPRLTSRQASTAQPPATQA